MLAAVVITIFTSDNLILLLLLLLLLVLSYWYFTDVTDTVDLHLKYRTDVHEHNHTLIL